MWSFENCFVLEIQHSLAEGEEEEEEEEEEEYEEEEKEEEEEEEAEEGGGGGGGVGGQEEKGEKQKEMERNLKKDKGILLRIISEENAFIATFEAVMVRYFPP